MTKNFFILFAFTISTSLAQVEKDTLFFHYDPEYIIDYKSEGKFSIKDTVGDEESFIFWKEKILCNLEPKEIKSLKNYVRNSTYYQKEKNIRLNDLRLAEHFSRFKIFLVRIKEGESKYIQVSPGTENY